MRARPRPAPPRCRLRLRCIPLLLACCALVIVCQWRLAPDSRLGDGIGRALLPQSTHRAPGVCTAARESPRPPPHESASERALQKLGYDAQRPRGAPSLLRLMQERAPASSAASVTVVLEFAGAGALCRQLGALLRQTAPAEAVWVSALRAVDGGDEARRIVSSFGEPDGRLSVVSGATLPGGGIDASGVSGMGRLARFALGLQAPTRHVLLLDAGVTPAPTLIETLSHVAALPEGASSVLGVAGWRSVRVEGAADADADASEGVGGGSLSLPLSGAGEGTAGEQGAARADGAMLEPMMEVDALRGCWFLKAAWLPLLFREAPTPDSTGAASEKEAAAISAAHDATREGNPPGQEAWISTVLRRHGDLSSLVLPRLRGGDTLGPPSEAQQAAWRSQLWASVRRGDPPPAWRAARGAPAGVEAAVEAAAAANARLVPTHAWGQPRGAQARPVLLLVVPSLAAAPSLSPLYSALASAASAYEPRLVLPPGLGGCGALAEAMELPAGTCGRAAAVYELGGDADAEYDYSQTMEEAPHRRGRPLTADETHSLTRSAAACAVLAVEVGRLLEASAPVAVISPLPPSPSPASAGRRRAARKSTSALSEAVRDAARSMAGAVLIEPPLDETALLEWVATLPPSALARWHDPRLHIAIITHKRAASLRRLLSSVDAAHLLGDSVDVTLSLEAAADEETVETVHGWDWRHGSTRIFRRAAKGGLITAVVESWSPSSPHSYGLLLEDDIEVSAYAYVYIKMALLQHVYADAADGGGGGAPPASLLGLSLYTPRLVELRMPRRRIDMYAVVQGVGGGGALYLQQLPCSWGAVFFPKPWLDFHAYMRERLHGSEPAVHIGGSATNGWSTSWKKFLIELCYLRGWVVLYPSFPNQSSFSTNHLEAGEHIGSKANTLKHRPIDFTVPLLADAAQLRTLWAHSPTGLLRRPAPLSALPVLDLFSDVSSQRALDAAAASARGGQGGLPGRAAAAAAGVLRSWWGS